MFRRLKFENCAWNHGRIKFDSDDVRPVSVSIFVMQVSAEHMLQTLPRPRFRIRLLSSSAGVQTETGDSRKVLQGNGCVVHTIVILFKLVSSLTFVKYFTALSLTSLEIFAKQATICQCVRPICKAMCLPCVIVTHFPFVVISPIQI